MQVSEILAIKGTVLYTVVPDKSLDTAVATMNDLDVGSLVCFDQGVMVGMLTFREVLKAVGVHGAGWGSVKIADVMVRNPVVAKPSMQMDELRRMMVAEHQRYLPVMDGTTLLGVVSFPLEISLTFVSAAEERNHDGRNHVAFARQVMHALFENII